ncbi:unnamed protein product, partial [Ranitomeya imitator]
MSEVTRILRWAENNHSVISAVHIPGVENWMADFLSLQGLASREWELHLEVFNQICLCWGIPDVDLMASRLNAKFTQFIAMSRHPRAIVPTILEFLQAGMDSGLALCFLKGEISALSVLFQRRIASKLQVRSVSVDLNTDPSLLIDIPDALSERDKVKFTVHTKTTLNTFQSPEFSVTRQHEDFLWLHDSLIETEEYAGIIIPPSPAKPDFDGPRDKMQKLGEGEGSMTKDEFAKMKQELEAEYLAVFKKTVSVHEIFLQRIASHPILNKDHNFHIFLEYDQDLSVRRKNTKEIFGGFFRSMVKSADEVLLYGVKEIDEFFDQEKTFLVSYHTRIKDSCAKSDKMTRSHK